MKKNYDDIINLPHHVSKKHPQMSMESRAAQFAPFAALTGYEDAVRETARLTEKRIDLDEGLKNILNNKLQYVLENLNNNPEITCTYFIYDKKKNGGKYVKKTGNVKKVDMVEKYIIFLDKSKILIDEIINITGDIFNNIDE